MMKITNTDSARLKQAAADVAEQAKNPNDIQILMRMVNHVRALTQLFAQAEAVNDNAGQRISDEQHQTLADMIMYYSATRGLDASALQAAVYDEFGVRYLGELLRFQYTDAATFILRWKRK